MKPDRKPERKADAPEHGHRPGLRRHRRRPRRTALWATLCALALSLGSLALASGPARTQTNAPAADAEAYASEFGVGTEEASRRVGLQRAAGKLEEELASLEEGSFAGLRIRHRPDFGVVVRLAGDEGPEEVRSRVAGGPLEGLVEVQAGSATLEELEGIREDAARAARNSGTPADTSVDVRQNRVEVLVEEAPPSPSALGVAARDPADEVAVIDVGDGDLAQPAVGRRGGRPGPMGGGLKVSTRSGGYCTTGFAVREDRATGVTTAGHCPSRLYRGNPSKKNRLPFRAQRFGGGQDVQWHATPRSKDVRRISVGRGHRTIRGSVPYSSQPVGAYVCKSGARTGKTCGTISGKWYAPNYVPNASPTFVGVSSGRPVVGPGDSGGPFFGGDDAYGTTIAYSRSGDTFYGYYMPIDGLSSLGVRLVTAR